MLPQFEKDGDMALYLTLCERQFKILKVPPDLWVTFLISSLPAEIGKLLAREPENKIHDFEKVKNIFLQRFKMNAEKYCILFSQHSLCLLGSRIINQVNGIRCADSGATRSIVGEGLHKILQKQGMKFIRESISMTFADGRSSTAEVLTTQSRKWYFSDNPHKSFPFENDVHVPPTPHMEYVSEVKTQFLCENEGNILTNQQRSTLNALLNENEVSRPEGEPTPYAEHHIDTQNYPHVAVPPYAVSPARREFLNAEINRLLNEGELNLNGLKDVTILSYLEDIIKLSRSFEEHLEDIRKVFQRLKQYKLQTNIDKYHFACSKIQFRGHLITPNGIEVDPEKTSAIQDMPEPKNAKQVQSFLQTYSRYRRFKPNFSDVAIPQQSYQKKHLFGAGNKKKKKHSTP
ncbi:Retrovirus-related Pol polyprotein from transposon 17.6 [Araneus ventricosus]|uniref:Retrovirus-related Pol polyprotein from transposon 17.6 n=1 Tax=Araneus ventricosus TaxID=182803 RepID=A0A4Y2PMD0_ARAVE|nr:Retrovirus-related Pol polyprotein from transposon 17.6 [Araneus ventricosus]